MTHTYKVGGITCSSCESKVRSALLSLPEISNIEFNKDKNQVSLNMSRHINIDKLKSALEKYPKYQIHNLPEATVEYAPLSSTWIQTYKPVLLIATYIIIICTLAEVNSTFNMDRWMQNFMAAFFIGFSFFKLLDIKGFTESYSTYDIIAQKWFIWGYIYAFIEAALGVMYLLKLYPLTTNIITSIIMLISIVGVLKSVINKQKIKCACLGTVFNLPMSTITIIEDGLMLIMSLFMIARLII